MGSILLIVPPLDPDYLDPAISNNVEQCRKLYNTQYYIIKIFIYLYKYNIYVIYVYIFEQIHTVIRSILRELKGFDGSSLNGGLLQNSARATASSKT